MKHTIAQAMGRALDQTRSGDLAAATRTIQSALGGQAPAGSEGTSSAAPGDVSPSTRDTAVTGLPHPRVSVPDAEILEDHPGPAANRRTAASQPRPEAQETQQREPQRTPQSDARAEARSEAQSEAQSRPQAEPSMRQSLSNVFSALSARQMPGGLASGLSGGLPGGLTSGLSGGLPGGKRSTRPPEVAPGASYERCRFTSSHGEREYTLYVPASLPDGPQGLVLMLHGCTQDADDFARGTGMNAVAERTGLIVCYPEQTCRSNAQGCWNWFRPGDQRAGSGEPELLAELARDIAARHDVPRTRIFAAGLSAGGAMAAILGVTHAGTFRAVGIHSGLPHGAAQDVGSAFAAMQGRGAGGAPVAVPAIVFHGTADATVAPANAQRCVDGSAKAEPARSFTTGGRTVRVSRYPASGSEIWLLEGAGHAWSGGSPDGSYTDAAGPDASAEMARFFLAA